MYLTLDSALGSGSAAIGAGGKLLAFEEIAEKGAQGKLLVTLIEKSMAAANVQYRDLTQVVCTIGPGGFTGIRIALATARAIGFSAHIPVQGVNTLTCLAYGFARPCMAILPAGKGMVYAQAFGESLAALSEPGLVAISDLEKVKMPMITATVSEIFGADKYITQKIELNAALLVRLAMDSKTAHVLTLPEPLYIRPPDITVPAAPI